MKECGDFRSLISFHNPMNELKQRFGIIKESLSQAYYSFSTFLEAYIGHFRCTSFKDLTGDED